MNNHRMGRIAFVFSALVFFIGLVKPLTSVSRGATVGQRTPSYRQAQIRRWVENALTWKATWSPWVVSCDWAITSDRTVEASRMIAVEVLDEGSGATALIAEIRKVIYVKRTEQGMLGSIYMLDSCARRVEDLAGRDKRDGISGSATPPSTLRALPEVQHITVNRSGPRKRGVTDTLPAGSQQQKLAFLSVVDAADHEFQRACSSKIDGSIEIPDFDLSAGWRRASVALRFENSSTQRGSK